LYPGHYAADFETPLGIYLLKRWLRLAVGETLRVWSVTKRRGTPVSDEGAARLLCANNILFWDNVEAPL